MSDYETAMSIIDFAEQMTNRAVRRAVVGATQSTQLMTEADEQLAELLKTMMGALSVGAYQVVKESLRQAYLSMGYNTSGSVRVENHYSRKFVLLDSERKKIMEVLCVPTS